MSRRNPRRQLSSLASAARQRVALGCTTVASGCGRPPATLAATRAATQAGVVLRDSGYVSRSQELWYGLAGPLYNVMTWWCFLPVGGERRIRQEIVRWIDARAGDRVLSLCCGTGTTEFALAAAVPDATIVAVDLGPGQIAEARRRNGHANLTFQVGDASETGLPDASFDRVTVALALHEMPADLRLRVLREAARVCKPDGRVVCIDHGRARGAPWLLRELWWGTWVPGNPERRTTHDLQRRGLDAEMCAAGLEVRERRATRWDWIEAIGGRPPTDDRAADQAVRQIGG